MTRNRRPYPACGRRSLIDDIHAMVDNHVKNLLHRTDRLLATLFRYTIIGFMVLITVVVFLQVLFRYVLNLPLSWSEEVARFGFVWLVFLGAGLIVRTGEHIKVSSFVDPLTDRLKKIAEIVVQVVIFVCTLIILLGGIRIARNEWSQLSPAIEAQMGVIYLVIPISAFMMVCWTVVHLVASITAILTENDK